MPLMRPLLYVVALAFVAIASCATMAWASFPGANGKIAYSAFPPEDGFAGYDVFAINPDGSGNTNLTNTYGLDMEADWSADGSRLIFQSDRHDPFSNLFDLYTMNADGSAQTRVTRFTEGPPPPGAAESPSWSPDGSRVAFNSGQRFGNPESYVMNADGSGATGIPLNSYYEFDPDWSPDGTLIAVPAGVIGGEEEAIFAQRPDATDASSATILVPGLWNEPDWSPDGSKLTFSGFGANGHVWVANADGTGLHPILGTHPAVNPVWSPDGTKIAFSRIGDTSTNVFVMDADGANMRQVTSRSSGTATVSSWQPLVGPQRGDYKNAAQFCKAERDFLGDSAFTAKYGRNGHGSDAHGSCVSQNQ